MLKVLVITDIHYDLTVEEKRLIDSASRTCSLCLLLGDIPLHILTYIRSTVNLPIYGVLGNHDTLDLLNQANIQNLHGRTATHSGIVLAGIGGSPRYKTDPDRPLYTQKEILTVEHRLERQPSADILIAHSSPYNRKADPPHRGFVGINRYLSHARPAYLLHGHDHDNSQTRKSYLFPRSRREAVQIICTYRVNVLDLQVPSPRESSN